MQGDNRMTLVKRSQTPKAAVSLGTISVVAIVCFVAGAMLPSRILSIAVPVSRAATPTGDGNEQAFISENDAAMNKMMADMTVKPSGDVNRDFVDMMVPHHQGAIDMAKALLVHGNNEALRRIAQEIVAMRLAIGEPAQPSAAPGTTTSPATGDAPGGVSGMQMSHDTMKMK
jgi:hypothetical protein